MGAIAYVFVVALNIFTALFKGVDTTGQAAHMWWPSIDASPPELTAQWLRSGNEAVMAGINPLDRGIVQPIAVIAVQHVVNGPVAAYVVGVVVNSTWAIGFLYFARSFGMPKGRVLLAVVLTALAWSIWLNTVYPWPKFVSAALLLGAVAMLNSRRVVLAGLLAGVSVLAHPASAVGVLGVAAWLLWMHRSARSVTAFAGIAFAVWTPWFAVGTSVHAPGYRQQLSKWHLAGAAISSPDDRPLPVVVSAYRDAGSGIVPYKINNLRLVVGEPTVSRILDDRNWTSGIAPLVPAWSNLLGWIRAAQLTRLMCAPGALLFFLLWWRRVPKGYWRFVVTLTLTYVLFEWGGSPRAAAYLHTAPYAVVVAWVGACALAARWWFVPVQVTAFRFLWLLAPPLIR